MEVMDVWGQWAVFFRATFSILIIIEVNSLIHYRGDDGIFPHCEIGFVIAKNSQIIIT